MKHKCIVIIGFLVVLILIIGHNFEDGKCIAGTTIIESFENEDSESNPIKIIPDEMTSFTMNLQAGWSLISLPLCTDNNSVSSLFPDAVVVYGYEKGKGYVRVQELECGRGYWVLLNQAQNYTITGQSIKEYTWTIDEKGWELIGGCICPAEASMDDGSIVVIYRYVQGQGYQRVTESGRLNPSEGYWILLSNIIDQTELKVYGICDTCYFSDDFEDGLGKWIVSGSDWAIIETDYCNPNSVTDSPDGDYPPNANSEMIMRKPIDLSNSSVPVLSFWHKVFLYHQYDHGYVEISEDGGLTWDVLADFTDRYQSTWSQVRIDLSAYKTTHILIRFRLRANSSSQADGWTIDDVRICEKDTQTLSFPFYDNFENGLGNWLAGCDSWAIMNSDYCNPSSVCESPDGNYPPNANSQLILSHPIDLSSSLSPILSFWHKILLYHQYDHGYVEISEDGGITWDILANFTDRYQSTWSLVRIDLSAYKTTPILIRFRLRANSSSQADGWTIDDVRICEKDTQTLSFPFYDNFENGLGNWRAGCDSWTIIDDDYCNPNHSVNESPGGNYPSNANSQLILAHPIDLFDTESPVLDLCHKICLYHQYDHGYIEISEDGGITWIIIKDFNNYCQTNWSFIRIDLSAYKTVPILIRFRLRANSSSQADGWMIDDVKIKELFD
ncbi:MAG: choice-of-anchor J domain-containing protein [bacterium]